MRLMAASRPTRVVVGLKARLHLLVDDAARQHVGHGAFQALAHLDTHAPVLQRHQDQDAVVALGVAEFPFLEHARGVFLDGSLRPWLAA
jgi:hypothetical protein